MGYQESLRELAAAYAISTGYTGFGGQPIEVSDDTLIKTLKALEVDISDHPSEEEIHRKLQERHDGEFSRPLPRSVVMIDEANYYLHVHVHDGAPADISITLEDGSLAKADQVENWTPARTIAGVTWGEATFEIPAGLPQGWHTITLTSTGIRETCPLIVTPARLSTTATYIDRPVHGVMAQMYSVRSEDSWGIGDFHDLATLGAFIAEQKAGDFLLVNPMHAGEPLPPVEDSPYLPTSRRFTNPIYIRIEDIPEIDLLDSDILEDIADIAEEFQSQNRDASIIDRNPIYAAKLQVLHEVFNAGRNKKREAEFQAYIAREGEGLARFASWCAKQEAKLAGGHAMDNANAVEFYMWLQWICDSQLAAAQQALRDAGMKIGIMADLAVGVHPGGSDAENLAEYLAPDASVGAPPDAYNQQGQDWSQPPWHPEKLAAAGYKPWRDMLRTVLRNSGGIRVDHVLGLFRLFWIPRLQDPSTGTYVNYDYRALVGILALEAERAGAVVIGEDLGTFEPWVQQALADYGIMGTSVLWFESSPSQGGPRYQGEYRQAALSSVTTHDLPPTCGYLEGRHITLREQLGLLITDADQEIAEDLNWQAEVLNRVKEQGGFEGEDNSVENFHGVARDERGDTETLVAALHRFIAHTPSALTCTALVDMVGDRRVQNQPGTTKDLYPNWCVPLTDHEGKAVLIEDLYSSSSFQHIAAASARP
ncbi:MULTISPECIES: 4-alpha-glucanotransferase [unclassified Corynebacterium]|uniref:4-alpha-glucanotransferase n=1 Tax=unclassified Corynebacterium TaxID=2624378 RepID=UPI00216A10EF|nr:MULTISPECIES: 4-alpha-glucanotransferase [unclassified Corynebacterium]MCS4490571.1 4-alpha-glucanotransferase [Corynebacterium sp. ES2775-CONJ]MCS4492350.1 4-alpha-glucanotransferase [Corynebacterium sp. ES2715-CONJ3]MCS4532458.1 4-alpha-glucanotransferase [Corynebacterium sp. ES2730-CONJ]